MLAQYRYPEFRNANICACPRCRRLSHGTCRQDALFSSDQTHGFDERRVGDHSANWPGNPTFSHGDLSGTSGSLAVSIRKSGPGTNAYDIKDRDTSAATVDWLRDARNRRNGGDERPFLLTVGLMLPHPPYVADPEDYSVVEGLVPAIRNPINAGRLGALRKHRNVRAQFGAPTMNGKSSVVVMDAAAWQEMKDQFDHVESPGSARA